VSIELTCRAVKGRPFAVALRGDALTLLRVLAIDHCELSLMIVSDREIRRLNREFRGKDQATDVLSFPQIEPSGDLVKSLAASAPDAPPIALGDIVISIDTATRQARELQQPAGVRIRTLLIHGMLHLLGYDHERSTAEARRMFAREHELAGLMDDADGRKTRTRLSKAPESAILTAPKGAFAAIDLRWSPAAMPERPASPVKKSSTKLETGTDSLRSG
jgi:rRNA maturation RNase YbeY